MATLHGRQTGSKVPACNGAGDEMPSCLWFNFQFLRSLEQLRRQSAHFKRVFGIDHFIINNAKQPDRIFEYI